MRSRPGPPKMRPRPCPAAIKSAAPASLRRSPPFPPRRLSPCHPPVCTSSPAPPPREPQLFRGALRRSSPRPPDETTPSLGNGAPGAGTIVSLPAPPPAIRKAPGPRRVTSSPDRPHRGGSGETGVVLGSGPPVELVGTPRADDFRKQITCSELELDLDFGTRPRAPVSRPARMDRGRAARSLRHRLRPHAHGFAGRLGLLWLVTCLVRPQRSSQTNPAIESISTLPRPTARTCPTTATRSPRS
jgi:hypothetical protein